MRQPQPIPQSAEPAELFVANSSGVHPAAFQALRSIFCPCSSVPVKNHASMPPVITNRSCTEPSFTPLLFLNRASRTGPFCVMNHGTVFFAPFNVASAINGFCAGLVPPAPGFEWQDKHWFELKRGPRPLWFRW